MWIVIALTAVAVLALKFHLDSRQHSEGGLFVVPSHPLKVRYLNTLGDWFKALTGKQLISVSAAEIKNNVEKKLKLHNYGNMHWMKGRDLLFKAFLEDPEISTFGRAFFKFNQAAVLEVKLQLEETFRNNPGLAQIPIKSPIFIIGLPRTGSTLLSRIMSQDPRFRTTYLWETMEPFPAPHPDTFFTDPRVEKVRKDLEMVSQLMPDMIKVHPMAADGQEEDMGLLHREYLCYMLAFWGDWPEYKDWMFNGDARPAYANHKRSLQHLSTNFDKNLRWLLKCPVHSNYIDAILATYPDAKFICLHRDMRAVMGSTISLAVQLGTPFMKKINTRKVARLTVDLCKEGVDRFMKSRDKYNDLTNQFIDIQYKDLMEDLLREIKKIYAGLEIEMLPSVEEAMKKWLKENPQGKHGRHSYSLEQWGLTDDVLRRFDDYVARYNIK